MLKHENIELSWIVFNCFSVNDKFLKLERITAHLMLLTAFNVVNKKKHVFSNAVLYNWKV